MKHTKRGSTHYRVGFTSRHRWGKRMSTATFPEGFDSTYDNKSIHLLAHHSSRTRSKAAAFTVALGLAFVALPAVGVGAATTPTPPNQTVAQATVCPETQPPQPRRCLAIWRRLIRCGRLRFQRRRQAPPWSPSASMTRE